MDFLNLEHKMNELAGYGIISGPFYGYAGAFQNILTDRDTTGAQKAVLLSSLIKDCLLEWEKRKKGEEQFLTPEEYGKLVNRSRSTIVRWLHKGKIGNARLIGSGNNAKWIILNRT